MISVQQFGFAQHPQEQRLVKGFTLMRILFLSLALKEGFFFHTRACGEGFGKGEGFWE